MERRANRVEEARHFGRRKVERRFDLLFDIDLTISYLSIAMKREDPKGGMRTNRMRNREHSLDPIRRREVVRLLLDVREHLLDERRVVNRRRPHRPGNLDHSSSSISRRLEEIEREGRERERGGTYVESPTALAAVITLNLLRRSSRDVVRRVDRARLLADLLLYVAEGLKVRGLAGVAVVDEGGFPAVRGGENQLTLERRRYPGREMMRKGRTKPKP